MYLRYILDDIRAHRRDPATLDGLPEDLCGYSSLEHQPHLVGHRPAGAGHSGRFAPSRQPHRTRPAANVDAAAIYPWLDGNLRAFLDQSRDGRHLVYVVRHQSLRDLFEPVEPHNRDAAGREVLHHAVTAAHQRITTALTPPGTADDRDWTGTDAYTRTTLPEHAAASGQLDDLVTDPGFLLTCDPPALLRRKQQ